MTFVRRIHQWPGHSPHKGPVTRKMILFDDVIMLTSVDIIVIFDAPFKTVERKFVSRVNAIR